MRKTLLFLFVCIGTFIQTVCAQVVDSSAQWAWIQGVLTAPTTTNRNGAISGTNINPGSRQLPGCWVDTSGNFWLFGGNGYPPVSGGAGNLNDLWKYNPSSRQWTFVNGVTGVINQTCIYGTKGTPSKTNRPGSRQSPATWTDTAGNLWLFGGLGSGPTTTSSYLNDLWMYNIKDSTWVWVSGTNTANPPGVFGNKFVGATTYIPGGRYQSSFWTDTSGNFWLFGGLGYDNINTTTGRLSDLWKYSPSTNEWTWMGGFKEISKTGVYGTKRSKSVNNSPGGRSSGQNWIDKQGSFWMFGGVGLATSATEGLLNDLWRFTPGDTSWTWMHGADDINQVGVYGVRGVADPANTPGSRFIIGTGTGFVDVNGNLWLFGGRGFPEAPAGNTAYNNNRMNDLWQYDIATNNWMWIKGTKTGGTSALAPAPVYGALGVHNPTYTPAGRTGYGNWTDKQGNFWVYAAVPASNILCDLWLLAPVAGPPAQPALYTVAKSNVCLGDINITYTVPAVIGATSYEWVYSGTGVTLSGGATTTTPTNNLTFSSTATGGILKVRAVNTVGGSLYRDTSIIVNSLPTVSVTNTGNQTICQGDSILLSATATGVNYQWKDGTTNVGTNSADYYAKTSGNYAVTVTNTTTNCTATSIPATVLTVNPIPAITINFQGNQAICQGDSLVLATTKISGVSYQWKNGASNIGTNDTGYTAKTSGNYTVTATNTTTNCFTVSPVASITINPLPLVTVNHTGVQAICQGDSLRLSATSSGVNYQWKDGATNVGTNNADYYAKTSGSYTVTVTDVLTNCSAVAAPATSLTVNTLPVAIMTAAGTTTICDGDSVTLTAGTGTGYIYQWRQGMANIATGSNIYKAYAAGDYKVIVTDGTTNCKDSSAAIVVTVLSKPVISLTPGDTAFCEGNAVTLIVATQNTGLDYLWKKNGAVVSNATVGFLQVQEAGTYIVIAGQPQTNNCIDSTNTVVVTIHPLPVVNVIWDGTSFHATTGFAAYQWNAGLQSIAGATNDVFTPSTEGGYSVTVIDSNGCSSTSPVYNTGKLHTQNMTALGNIIKVYPNPSNGWVHIAAPGAIHVTLSSIDGKQLLQQSGNGNIDMRSYADGIYLLRISDKQGTLIKNEKVIKTSW